MRRFDHDLAQLNSLVLRMGGHVQEQTGKAIAALRDQDMEGAYEVIAGDHIVNLMDVQADEAIVQLLALRQPLARDLRTVIALGKVVAALERSGDQAKRIARLTIELYQHGKSARHELTRHTLPMSILARSMLQRSLDAMARLDVQAALAVLKEEVDLDREFHSAQRCLASYIIEDASNVGATINVTYILRALERIGDHAKGIADQVIYAVNGKDVRHVSPESLTPAVLEAP